MSYHNLFKKYISKKIKSYMYILVILNKFPCNQHNHSHSNNIKIITINKITLQQNQRSIIKTTLQKEKLHLIANEI